MALWGNKDNKTANGTVSIASNGFVTGTTTDFVVQAKIGNTLKAANIEYQIVTISSNTVAKVIMGLNNGNGLVTTCTAESYTLSEKPAFVSREASVTTGISGDSSFVYGVDTTEISVGGNSLTDIAIIQSGTNYLEAPTVTITQSGGPNTATATATVSTANVVSAITVTGAGADLTRVPTINIAYPRRTITAARVTLATEIIGYGSAGTTLHNLSNGAILAYNDGGGAAMKDAGANIANGTIYYASIASTSSFKLYNSSANAAIGGANGLANISSQGTNTQYFELQGETKATAIAVLGSGDSNNSVSGEQQVTHSGWVRKTIGTGGRAGRVTFETLVATGTITSDAADDAKFPDA